MILGLDLSLTSTGFCSLSTSNSDFTNHKYDYKAGVLQTKKKGTERLAYLKACIDNLLEEFNPRLVVAEGYSFGSTGQSFSIGELGGVVKLLLFDSGFRTLVVPPKSLKKFVTGNGNSSKDLMLMKTLAKYKVEFLDNNVCDAFGLCMVGVAFLYGTLVQYEKEILTKVELYDW